MSLVVDEPASNGAAADGGAIDAARRVGVPPFAWYTGWFHLWVSFLGALTAVAIGVQWGVPLCARVCLWGALLLSGIGITVGYHRLFTHRSFETVRWVEWLLAALGSSTGEGALLWWVANHRQHHQFSDAPGDPHSPYMTREGKPLGFWSGLWHAHLHWLQPEAISYDPRYVRDLEARRDLMWFHRTWFAWHVGGLLAPAAICFAVERTAYAALMGFLWSGLLRYFVVEHLTLLVNSLAHRVGRQPHAESDGSRNNWLVAFLSFGEGWHNNHHAHPTSAAIGHHWWQVDLGWMFIRLLEVLGLAWNVRRPPGSHARGHSSGRAPA